MLFRKTAVPLTAVSSSPLIVNLKRLTDQIQRPHLSYKMTKPAPTLPNSFTSPLAASIGTWSLWQLQPSPAELSARSASLLCGVDPSSRSFFGSSIVYDTQGLPLQGQLLPHGMYTKARCCKELPLDSTSSLSFTFISNRPDPNSV
ncbi:hypothetical protein KFK09_028610 [Dendrobium nobile]|uniref:Uncharacterized protein n=1 Tax=Dendrobium nobile TaxID=94219 RepID=A0A8T3A3J3_DENNO|nr:hypothetical protein KFK09_028610 [Dendrobium nobile]